MKVTLNAVTPHSFHSAVGDPQKGARYQVLVNDVVVGEVAKHSNESWRKCGRIRTSMIGYERHWEADLEAQTDIVIPWSSRRVGYHFSTRQAAVDALVAAYLTYHPEVK